MAYQRRYMRPFVGTTVVIQDEAVTTDKIDDKSVEEGKLADDAVSERVIGTGAVDTDELKDGAVKTIDIGDKQVTNAKLADSTIEEDKLAFSPSTRPLTPGVATAEIADDAVDKDKIGPEAVETAGVKDGAVTAAKLAGDAVETVKIKDDNVTGDKIADSQIGNEHIKADAVRGTEIQDGAVSEGKIGTDAVTTVKIKNANVTESKLEADILRKLLDSSQLLYDDFIGATLRPEWASSGDAGGSISRAQSMLQITANSTDDHKYRVNCGSDFFTSIGDLPRLFLRGIQNLVGLHIRFGFYANDNNYILFDFDTDVDANWHVKTKKAGAETDQDTGVAATAVLHEFFIEVLSPTAVKFYIDGAQKALNSTNIPTTVMMPWMEVQNRAASSHWFKVDKIIYSSDKSVGTPPP